MGLALAQGYEEYSHFVHPFHPFVSQFLSCVGAFSFWLCFGRQKIPVVYIFFFFFFDKKRKAKTRQSIKEGSYP